MVLEKFLGFLEGVDGSKRGPGVLEGLHEEAKMILEEVQGILGTVNVTVAMVTCYFKHIEL